MDYVVLDIGGCVLLAHSHLTPRVLSSARLLSAWTRSDDERRRPVDAVKPGKHPSQLQPEVINSHRPALQDVVIRLLSKTQGSEQMRATNPQREQ